MMIQTDLEARVKGKGKISALAKTFAGHTHIYVSFTFSNNRSNNKGDIIFLVW